ncbi:hypothetical protein DERF_007497 [Dermatophagoides farinae]|uniref:Ral GTPase-activating protein subunit alpha/beta N-terminal domain-containing protein n=1 Tax=Dermatophagoides farinae TaxID=6954 RepID=A0A922L379_DERFA|nr:hypothetical protein DERF_007497 [Dermatophagoides farinae]
MFTEYALIDIEDICYQKSISVLNKLPEVNGPQLVTSLIKPLVNNLINKSNKQNESFLNCFQDDKDVHWIMEVIGYGLSLPLADNEQYEAVRDCVNIYCEWLHALSPSLSQDKSIPYPIRHDPNIYCQKILGHLYNTFLPRTWNNQTTNTDAINDLISKQALICHRILRLVIAIATERDNVISAKTWEHLLIFLLGINEKLLKSPTDTNDIGTQIADRVISTLFQGWLISCVYFFPSPSFWRTFQNVCVNSRHCPALIAQWNRVNICLTKRLVSVLYNHESTVPVDNKINFSQYNSIVLLLSEDVLEQCWYRFLHITGNPIDLCFPKTICKMDPEWNVNLLPPLKDFVHWWIYFLGIPNINLSDIEYELPKSAGNSFHAQPEKRKPNFSVLKGEKHSSSTRSNQTHHVISKNNTSDPYCLPTIVLPSLLSGNFHQNHIKLSSILDIFGKWLFPAAFIGVPNISGDLLEKSLSNSDTSLQGTQKFERMNIPATDTDVEFSLELFEAGQAEALGALCRIFCLKKDNEDISLILSKQNHPDFSKLKNYLTSFYLALKFNLQNINQNDQSRIQISSSILVNSIYLFEVDLPGSKILIPHFFRCIESFLTRKDKNDSAIHVLIRRACIKILISLLSYPIHYKNLPIKDDLSETTCNTFISFFPRLILLFINALYNEPDQINVQMILNAFLFIIEDCFNYRQDMNGQNVYMGQNEISIESKDSLVVNLMEFFNKNNCFHLQNDSQAQKLAINLFLLITSFISDILCKSSLKNSNYNISLTAIEILLAMGRIRSKSNSHQHKSKLLCNNKCSLCIRQICRFIENQCCKPAMFHSKDMHSTIVAAYQCLAIWIDEHHHLVNDQNCIALLFELIELGISGSKSSKEDAMQFKAEKEAAELFLATLMSRIKMGVESNENIIPCDINEAKIAEQIFNIRSTDYSFNQFRYFVVENSLLISILDKQVGHGETVCIIRSAYGKYCFVLKHQPISNRHLLNMGNEISIYRRRGYFRCQFQQYYSNTPFKYFLTSLGNEISCETNICSSIFYWNDVLHELIFITPTKQYELQRTHEYQIKNENQQTVSLNTFISENNDTIRTMFLQRSQQQHSTTSPNNGYAETTRNHSPNERIKEFLFMNNGCDIKVFILWIEKMDDFDRLPFNKNGFEHSANACSDGSDKQNPIFIITIHPLKNGLFRVLNFMPNSNKFNNYPTIDRMLLSKSLLASYVKLITLNLFRRRRMNTESFQFPHVKRRVKIQEMANKFKISSTNEQKLASEIFKSKFL